MAVRWQRAVWLLVVASNLAWMAAFAQAGPVLMLLLPVGGVLLHLSAFAFEMLMVAWQHGSDPAPRPSARALAAAAWRESGLAMRVFAWRQPWRSAAWPDRTDAPGVQGVVLVHGYLCNRAVWQGWYAGLREHGVPHVGVSLSPAWADIDRYAPQLEQAVAQLVRATGRTPVLVGHSMGGLVIRAWWRWRCQRLAGGEASDLLPLEMPQVLTLGTPHRGTWLSRGRGPVNVRQMAPDSAWLTALAAGEGRDWRSRFTCVHSHCDNVVFPPSRALLSGARAVHWPGLAHLELAHDPRGLRIVLELLSAGPARCAG